MRCPICQKQAEPHYRPFCSKRCADVDLGRWFNENYTFEAEETDISDTDQSDDLRPRMS
jgi:endogenous inhibitor of DNA gyrase (YacG/DUF329 family)